MIYLLTLLWAIRSAKAELFWLYLLQLKEYKIKRLIDHFRTEKGKRILLDPFTIAKILLAMTAAYTREYLPYIALSIYILEAGLAAKSAYFKQIKIPTITSKTISLIAILLGAQAVYGALTLAYMKDPIEAAAFLIVFDIWIPFLTTGIAMLLKPFNYILRLKVINAAKLKRAGLKNLLVIGVTGSYGKTSTKEFLYEILKNKFNVVRTPEHVNTEIGVAEFVLSKLTDKNEIFICEMGAYEIGEVKAIVEIAMPKMGIFVGTNEQHLALFGSMKNLLRAEGGEELLESLPKNGLAIFNGNNTYAYDLYKKTSISKRITYAPNLIEIINPEKRDVRAENIRVEKDHIAFRAFTAKNSKGVEFRVNLLGGHNIENLLLCIAAAEAIGMTLEEIKEASKDIEPFPRSMSMSKNSDGATVINSTYSSNPNALTAHIEYLKTWDGAKKIVIMPCLIELGSASKRIHENLGHLLARGVDLAIITTKDRFEDIMLGASAEIGSEMSAEKILYIEDSTKISATVRNFYSKGDVILLEGRLSDGLVNKLTN